MTSDELKQQLIELGFVKDKSSEYHNELFENVEYEFFGRKLQIYAYVDRYTIRFVWWHEKGKKVAKCYYIKKDVGMYDRVTDLISDFLNDMVKMYGLKVS